jgi:hypothetical protein
VLQKNFIVGGENLQLRLKFAIAVETPHIKFVPVDSVVLDVECNAFCSIVLGRPFLRTVGAIIDMRDGIIRYQFPLKKGMEHFPRKRKKLPFDSIIRTNYDIDASSLDNNLKKLWEPWVQLFLLLSLRRKLMWVRSKSSCMSLRCLSQRIIMSLKLIKPLVPLWEI